MPDDESSHARLDAVGGCPIHRVEDAQDLVLDQLAQAFTAARALAYRFDDLVRRSHAHIRHDEQFLERLERVDVDRTGPLLRRIRLLDERLEPLLKLLRRPRQTGFQLVK